MRIENRTGALRLILLVLVVWLPILALLAFEPQIELADGKRISQKTAFINLCGVAFIVLGIFLSRLLLRGRQKSRAPEPWGPRADFIALTILLLVSLLGAFLGVLTWRELGVDPLSIGERTLYEMNVIYAQEERVISGLPGRLITLALIGLLYALYLQREKRIKWPTTLVFGIFFMAAMFSPRRALLLSAMISAVMLWFLSQEKIKPLRAIKMIIPIAVIILSFGFTQYLLHKQEEFSIFGSIRAIVEYYIYSFYVMDGLLETSHFEQTLIILSVPERILSYIFNYSPNVDLSIPFLYVPEPANTVPAFYYFYRSGGFIGVIVSSLVIGWVFMYLYTKMKVEPSLFNFIASSLFATGIVLSPRQCLFIEYDFLFLLAVALVLDWQRKSGRLRRRFRRAPVSHWPKRPIT